jgi:hypothetical protein
MIRSHFTAGVRGLKEMVAVVERSVKPMLRKVAFY